MFGVFASPPASGSGCGCVCVCECAGGLGGCGPRLSVHLRKYLRSLYDKSHFWSSQAVRVCLCLYVCVWVVFSTSCTLQPGGLRNLTGGGAGRRGPVCGQASPALHPRPLRIPPPLVTAVSVRGSRPPPESSEETGNSSFLKANAAVGGARARWGGLS